MNEKILLNAGLSIEQTKIYLSLLENGLMTAKTISNKTKIGRALVYKVLDQLLKLDLIERRDEINKVSMFIACHPQKIRELIQIKKYEADIASQQTEIGYGRLLSTYNSLFGRPNVQFYEGIDGLKQVYSDILDTGQDIKIIRSILDHKEDNIANLLREQIRQQVKMGIKVKLIGPKRKDAEVKVLQEKDRERRVTRKTVYNGLLLPSQVIIFGDKVAITDFKDKMVTTIIENQNIRETFDKIFDFMFESIKEEY